MKQESSTYVEYWERTVPWTFKDEKTGYFEKRRLRYGLQDYMFDVIPFSSYKGKRVLDVGSGSGIDSAEFGRNGANVVSLDFTETGASSTRNTLKEAGVPSNVVRAAAQSLPFRDDAFDCVYSFGVLHHIPNIRRAVQEIARVLGTEGDFVSMLYNKDSILYAYSILFLHRMEGLNEDELLSRYSERVENCPYTKAYTKEEVKELLRREFQDLAMQVCFSAIDTPNERKVKLGVPDEAELGWHIITKARKKETRSSNRNRPAKFLQD